jgi:hypothetical protein
MKTLKTVILGLLIANSAVAQFHFGLQVSSNVSGAVTTGSQLSSEPFSSRTFGVVTNYTYKERLSLRTGISLLENGNIMKFDFAESADEPGMKATSTTAIKNVQLPVTVFYNFPMKKRILQIGIGGFANYGYKGSTTIKGTMFYDGESADIDVKQNIYDLDDEGIKVFNRVDVGFSSSIGLISRRRVFSTLTYQMGLGNLAKLPNESYKTRGLQFSMGYFFK